MREKHAFSYNDLYALQHEFNPTYRVEQGSLTLRDDFVHEGEDYRFFEEFSEVSKKGEPLRIEIDFSCFKHNDYTKSHVDTIPEGGRVHLLEKIFEEAKNLGLEKDALGSVKQFTGHLYSALGFGKGEHSFSRDNSTGLIYGFDWFNWLTAPLINMGVENKIVGMLAQSTYGLLLDYEEHEDKYNSPDVGEGIDFATKVLNRVSLGVRYGLEKAGQGIWKNRELVSIAIKAKESYEGDSRRKNVYKGLVKKAVSQLFPGIRFTVADTGATDFEIVLDKPFPLKDVGKVRAAAKRVVLSHVRATAGGEAL